MNYHLGKRSIIIFVSFARPVSGNNSTQTIREAVRKKEGQAPQAQCHDRRLPIGEKVPKAVKSAGFDGGQTGEWS